MIDSLRNWKRNIYTFNSHRRREWVADFASRVTAGSRVLDAGAGSGQYRAYFEHCEYRTQDFGLEPGTRGKYTALDYECDITAIPVPDGSFDVILCLEVLEHLPDPGKGIMELARVLAPGGRMLLSAPLGSRLHQEPFHFYGGFTPHWYRKFLSEAGLVIEYIERNQGFFSLYGQETIRYLELLKPNRSRQASLMASLALAVLWVLIAPLAVLMPLLGNWLDRLGLENDATAGYQVLAKKKGPDFEA